MKKTYQIGIDSDIDRIIAEINEHPEISVQLDISIESSGFQIDPVAAANGQPFVTIQSNTNDIENIITSKLLPCIQRILSETGLVELSLCHLGLTSENIKSIFSGQENSTIKYLNLENNCLGYSGVNFLAECLINYKSLETLVIGGNVGFKGAESLAKFLTQTTSLKVLNLESIMNNKGIGDEGLGYIIQALNGNESLEELNCGFNQISFEHDSLLELSSYKNIKVFTLGSNIISRNGLFKLCDVLKSNSKIETLSLINNPLNDDGAELIAQFLQDNKSLKSLDIRSTRIGDTGISCIAKALPVAQNLQGFYIGDNPITSATLNAVITSIPQTIKAFDISRIEIDDEAVSNIITLLNGNSLDFLNLSSTQMTKKHFEKISNAVEINKNLKFIDLSSSSLGKDVVGVILQKLENNKSLWSLIMRDSLNKDTNFDNIYKLLKANKALTSVTISSFPNNHWDQDGKIGSQACQKIQTYTNRNENYALKLAKFIHLNKDNIFGNKNLLVPNELLEYSNCTGFTNPETPINFFSLFFSVSTHFLSKCINGLVGARDAENLKQAFQRYIAGKFFHIAGICKEFAPSYFAKLPTEMLPKIIIEYDIKLPCGPNFTVPLDMTCSGDSSSSEEEA